MAASCLTLYDHPEVYEACFSWRDYAWEAHTLSKLWLDADHTQPGVILDLACGSARIAPDLHHCGWRYIGIDHNYPMLQAARKRQAWVLQGNYQAVGVAQVDAVMVMLGSLYLQNLDQFHEHLTHLARIVHPQGIYFMDWVTLFDSPEAHADTWSWSEGTADYQMNWYDRQQGLVQEILKVTHKEQQYRAVTIQYALTVEKCNAVIESHPDWELHGHWNDWEIGNPARANANNRPLSILLRN